jgi:acyl-CoA synthetase (AMP-forming)/AMP-acid ligase II
VAWGAQRRGTYWTPVNWHLTAGEARYIVRDCGARVLFASPENADVAALVAADEPGLAVFVTGGEQESGLASYEAAISAQSAEPIDDEVDGAVPFYSSGTTGRPKGIKPKHEFPPFGSPSTLALLMSAVLGFGPDSVYLCPAPLYHAAPGNFSLGTQRLGGTVVLMDRFDPAGCLRALEAHHVSHVQFVPTHFVRMLKLPAEQPLGFALDDRGWSTLGDIGHVDAEGFFYLSDRRTDLIISGGVNIYPAEIEEALISHPAVDDVAVIGVPDPEMGQQVLAVVQLTERETGSADLAAELVEHCRARLASFKRPRSVEFVAELPRLPTGKLLRRQLRAERAGQAR